MRGRGIGTLVLGTLAYLAPEQRAGSVATPASDRYALGLVARELLTGARPQTEATPAAKLDFGDALASVSKLQAQSGAVSEAFERGDMTDIAQVMIARQKASVAFEATLQVRNKLLGAYRDIMNMGM